MSELSAQFSGLAAVTGFTVQTATSKTILGPLDVQAYDRYSFYLDNTGINDVMGVSMQTAPVTAGPWVDDVGFFLSAPAAGSAAVATNTNKSYKYIRFRGTSMIGETTVDAWLSVGADL